jgi:hypothetical protein
VWGAYDIKTYRKIFAFVPPASFDDSMFQQWVETSIEPNIAFEFSLVPWEDDVAGGAVAVFKIYPSDDRPFVAIQNVGEDFFAGQVWFRRGTKNTVALKQDLQGFFSPGVQLDVGFLGSNGRLKTRLQLPAFKESSIGPSLSAKAEITNLVSEIRAENKKLDRIYNPRPKTVSPSDPRIIALEATLKEMRKGLKEIGYSPMLDHLTIPVIIDPSRLQDVAERCTGFGIPIKTTELDLAELRRDTHSGLLGSYHYYGAEKDKYQHFRDLESVLNKIEYNVGEGKRVSRYQWVKISVLNIGRVAAHHVSTTGKATGGRQIAMFTRVPKPRPQPEPKHPLIPSVNLDFTPAHEYEPNLISQSKNTCDLLVPGDVKEIDWFAVATDWPGTYTLNVIVRGQDIPEPLSFDLEIVIE